MSDAKSYIAPFELNAPITSGVIGRVQTYLIKTSSLMKGFTLGDYTSRFPEGMKALAGWLQAGQLQYEETVTEGFDQTIDAFLDLFKGANIGKSIVKVAEIEW